MAATTLQGKAGSIQWAGTAAVGFNEWTLNPDMQFEDVSEFGDTGTRQASTGFMKCTGTAKGFLDIADTNGQVVMRTAMLAGTTAAVKFFIDGSHYFTGTFLIKATMSAAPGKQVAVTYNFELAGGAAVTYA